MIRVINDIDELDSLRDCWEALFEENVNCTPFQSFDYNRISWKRLQKDNSTLFIIVYSYKQEKMPCAIFPFCIDSYHCLRFINEEHSDFQTALITKSAQTNLAMYEEIYDYIKKQSEIDRICLDHLRHDDYLLHYFKQVSIYARLYGTESYSYLPIVANQTDSNFIDSLHHLTAKERNRLKNIEKKAEGLSFKVISIDDYDYPESEVLDLVQKMIRSGIRSETYFTTDLLAFIKDLYLAGVLKIGLIYHGAELGSASFFYQNDKGLSIQWIIIYSDKIYNLQAKLRIINSIYENGGGIFNLGRGTYKYKIQHFRPVIQYLFQNRFHIIRVQMPVIASRHGQVAPGNLRMLVHQLYKLMAALPDKLQVRIISPVVLCRKAYQIVCSSHSSRFGVQ